MKKFPGLGGILYGSFKELKLVNIQQAKLILVQPIYGMNFNALSNCLSSNYCGKKNCRFYLRLRREQKINKTVSLSHLSIRKTHS